MVTESPRRRDDGIGVQEGADAERGIEVAQVHPGRPRFRYQGDGQASAGGGVHAEIVEVEHPVRAQGAGEGPVGRGDGLAPDPPDPVVGVGGVPVQGLVPRPHVVVRVRHHRNVDQDGLQQTGGPGGQGLGDLEPVLHPVGVVVDGQVVVHPEALGVHRHRREPEGGREIQPVTGDVVRGLVAVVVQAAVDRRRRRQVGGDTGIELFRIPHELRRPVVVELVRFGVGFLGVDAKPQDVPSAEDLNRSLIDALGPDSAVEAADTHGIHRVVLVVEPEGRVGGHRHLVPGVVKRRAPVGVVLAAVEKGGQVHVADGRPLVVPGYEAVVPARGDGGFQFHRIGFQDHERTDHGVGRAPLPGAVQGPDGVVPGPRGERIRDLPGDVEEAGGGRTRVGARCGPAGRVAVHPRGVVGGAIPAYGDGVVRGGDVQRRTHGEPRRHRRRILVQVVAVVDEGLPDVLPVVVELVDEAPEELHGVAGAPPIVCAGGVDHVEDLVLPSRHPVREGAHRRVELGVVVVALQTVHQVPHDGGEVALRLGRVLRVGTAGIHAQRIDGQMVQAALGGVPAVFDPVGHEPAQEVGQPLVPGHPTGLIAPQAVPAIVQRPVPDLVAVPVAVVVQLPRMVVVVAEPADIEMVTVLVQDHVLRPPVLGGDVDLLEPRVVGAVGIGPEQLHLGGYPARGDRRYSRARTRVSARYMAAWEFWVSGSTKPTTSWSVSTFSYTGEAKLQVSS